ncbi:APC family permease [Sanguibacter sp. 25GB23B1]|uniref:APC family permease n=1 Tax=unclassified Sanguibacter TaxID=2645534 RepID=UPI0032AFBD80
MTLRRSLGTGDAIVIGLASMLGAGVFAVLAPAAQAAGGALLGALALAAVVAACNASSTAQLAARYPTSGGAYAYGRARLGPWWGFVAGWSFVVGKTASCAAMALTFAAYAAPAGWEKPVAALAVVALGLVNLRGITRTARAARVILVVVLVALVVVVAAGLGSDPPATGTGGVVPVMPVHEPVDWYGVAQAAGLLFFAFAGYARVATLGEEVRDPARTIPRAVLGALGATLVVYVLVAASAEHALGTDGLAASDVPLVDVVRAAGWAWAAPLVVVGAAAASLGALLALQAGVGRTTLAMARERDLPAGLAAVHPTTGVPHRAEVAVIVAAVLLVLVADVRGAIGFSSFGVLLYYLVANVAAWTQPPSERRFPRPVAVVGAIGCLGLCATLPGEAVVGGVVVLAAGAGYRVLTRRARAAGPGSPDGPPAG